MFCNKPVARNISMFITSRFLVIGGILNMVRHFSIKNAKVGKKIHIYHMSTPFSAYYCSFYLSSLYFATFIIIKGGVNAS